MGKGWGGRGTLHMIKRRLHKEKGPTIKEKGRIDGRDHIYK